MISLLAALVFHSAPAVSGLDHLIVAVRDLDAAAADYRRLGFSLKPGRPHANSIENSHVKFLEGTEIELLTATKPLDSISRGYVDFLAKREGPRFAVLFSEDHNTLMSVLQGMAIKGSRSSGIVSIRGTAGLDHFFFGGRNLSPTDKPDHFRHPNGAVELTGVWIQAQDLVRNVQFLRGLGAEISSRTGDSPFTGSVTTARFGSHVVSLRKGPTRIVGATLRTKDLAQTRFHFRKVGMPVVDGRERLLIRPEDAKGAWLEFKE